MTTRQLNLNIIYELTFSGHIIVDIYSSYICSVVGTLSRQRPLWDANAAEVVVFHAANLLNVQSLSSAIPFLRQT